jgi:hypothetical protein
MTRGISDGKGTKLNWVAEIYGDGVQRKRAIQRMHSSVTGHQGSDDTVTVRP